MNANKTKPFVRYVIVVHGIGQSSKNSTVIDVVNRFAEARSRQACDDNGVLTLGKAAGQVLGDQRPWMAFAGIPQNPEQAQDGPFFGEPCVEGNNLRFVEIWWSDLLAKYEDDDRVLEPPEVWGAKLLCRLQRKDDASKRNGREGVPAWILETLHTLIQTVAVARLLMSFRFKELEQTIFYDYLGDVQAYGEYAVCRGEAVARLHHVMECLDRSADEAHYTIIAHSLGSIMSLDALLYAHAKNGIRNAPSSVMVMDNLPFSRYREYQGDQLADVSWVERVDSLVTLGSPIDKFLMLWWTNYKYLNEPKTWMDDSLLALRQQDENKIQHFNYCDEQDPVGHKLDLVAGTPAYQAVFRKAEDQVYNRFAVPGLAHTSYWKDRDLFRWILHRAVDRLPAAPSLQPQWFNTLTFLKILMISYFVIPTAVIAADYFAFTLAWNQRTSWHMAVIATLGFVLVAWLGRKVLNLMIVWRRVVQVKDKGAETPSDPWKTALEWVFWIFTLTSPFVWAVTTAWLVARYRNAGGMLWGDQFAVPIAAVLTMGLIWLRSARERWQWHQRGADVITVGVVLVVFYWGIQDVWSASYPQCLGNSFEWLATLCKQPKICYFHLGAFFLTTTIVSTYVAARFWLTKLLFPPAGETVDIGQYLKQP